MYTLCKTKIIDKLQLIVSIILYNEIQNILK